MIKNIEHLSLLHSFLSAFCWKCLSSNISKSYIENSGSHFFYLNPFCCENLSFNILKEHHER